MESRLLPRSSMERGLLRLVSSYWFLLAFFLAGILGFIVGFQMPPGTGGMGLPLLAWFPFGVLLALNEWMKTFRRARASEIPMMAAIIPLLRGLLLGGWGFYIVVALVIHLPLPPQWTIWVAALVGLLPTGRLLGRPKRTLERRNG